MYKLSPIENLFVSGVTARDAARQLGRRVRDVQAAFNKMAPSHLEMTLAVEEQAEREYSRDRRVIRSGAHLTADHGESDDRFSGTVNSAYVGIRVYGTGSLRQASIERTGDVTFLHVDGMQKRTL